MGRAASLFLSREFAKFLVVGGVALALHWLSRFAFNYFMPFWQAVIWAYGVGIASAYFLNRRFVFARSGRSMGTELARFATVNLIAFPLVWGLSIVLGDKLFPLVLPTAIAHALGHGVAVTVPVVLNYTLHKFWTFRRTDA